MITLVSLFDKAAEKNPDHIAYIFGDNKIEYGKIQEAVNRLVQGFVSLGVAKGDRIAVMLPNVPHFPISYYAIQKAGAIVVPINFTLAKEKIIKILEDCNPRILIAWTGFGLQLLAELVSGAKIEKLILLGQEIPHDSLSLTQLIANSRPWQGPVEIDPSDTAMISYTAGITSAQKGVELSHYAMATGAQSCQEIFKLSGPDVVAVVLPLFMSVVQALTINLALTSNSTVVLQPKIHAEEIAVSLINNRVTFLPALPGVFAALEKLTMDVSQNHLNYCVCFGGPIPEDLLRNFESKFNAFIFEGYMMTEVAALITCNRIDRERKIGSVGLPVFGTELQIVSEHGQFLPPGESGEILVRSNSVMKGYYKNPEASAQVIKNSWFNTGDIGRVDDDHFFYIEERKSDVITKGGFRVFPSEIESALMKHPAVKEAAVIGIPDDMTGEEVKAFVVLQPDANIGSKELIAYCMESLSRYKCPKYIDFIETLPRSMTGRVLRRKLREKTNDYPDFDGLS